MMKVLQYLALVLVSSSPLLLAQASMAPMAPAQPAMTPAPSTPISTPATSPQPAVAQASAVPVGNPAIIPSMPGKPGWAIQTDWLKRHNEFVQVAKAGGVDLLFLGDSITDFWRDKGKDVWAKTYAPLKAANFGLSGDKTQYVLWRIENGELDGITPKVVVLLIGTNNWRQPVPEIAEGVTAVVQEIQKRLPTTKVLLLGIFPRLKNPTEPMRQEFKEVNAILAKLDDNKQVFFLDIGSRFLDATGVLTPDIMPDAIHPSAIGYQIWADAMQDKLQTLMK